MKFRFNNDWLWGGTLAEKYVSTRKGRKPCIDLHFIHYAADQLPASLYWRCYELVSLYWWFYGKFVDARKNV